MSLRANFHKQENHATSNHCELKIFFNKRMQLSCPTLSHVEKIKRIRKYQKKSGKLFNARELKIFFNKRMQFLGAGRAISLLLALRKVFNEKSWKNV